MTSRFSKEFWLSLRGYELSGSATCFQGAASREFRSPQIAPPPGSPGGTALPSDRPCGHDENCSIYLPEPYEPNYAYPLLVWFQGADGADRDLQQLMPQVSSQNFLGLSFPWSLPMDGSAGTVNLRRSVSLADLSDFETRLHDTVCRFRREYHVHSERIYLAGFDSGATLALGLLLRKPEWFAGAILFGGQFPQTEHPLFRFRDLQGKRMLIGAGSRDPRRSVRDIVHAGRLLYTAGMDVSTRIYDTGHEMTPKMLGDINHWVLEGIGSTNLVY